MKAYLLPEERIYKIMARNTGVHFVFDKADWERLKDIVLVQTKMGLATGAGVLVVDYLKITGKRNSEAPKTDFRRMWFD